MDEFRHVPAAPAAGDVVEIVDGVSGASAHAAVESVADGHYVLRFDGGAAVPDEARIRWYDGDTAWQAVSQLERLDDTSASFELAPVGDWEPAPERRSLRAPDWEPAPVRQSLRAPVDNSPLLVEIVSSGVLAEACRVHAICLDISGSGCRAKWPGLAPLVGDNVKVAWDVGDWNADAEPGWVSARVARISALPFGARQVAFTFDITDAAQGERVRAWHQAWLQEYRQRLRQHRAA
jgi:hypothetical protein